jgi:hypothetical protein
MPIRKVPVRISEEGSNALSSLLAAFTKLSTQATVRIAMPLCPRGTNTGPTGQSFETLYTGYLE